VPAGISGDQAGTGSGGAVDDDYAPAAGTASASAATRAVDDDGRATPRNCNAQDVASTSIQAAVTASSAGDTIVVCPGTYTEQVRVPADKDRLTLVSSSRRQAIIKAPPAYGNGTVDLVRVDGAENVRSTRSRSPARSRTPRTATRCW